MSRFALALAGLLSLSALAQESARTPDGEGRRIAERYEDEVRQRAGELADMPVNVAPPVPVDDRVPPADDNFARGRLRNCDPRPMHESRLPLCADLEAKQREEEAARRRAEEEARRKAGEVAGRNGSGGGSGNETPPGKPPRDYSKYSCWAAPADCLVVSGEWGSKPSEREKRLYRIHLRNTCDRRIYAHFCLQRAGQKPWCTYDGLKPGEERPFSTNNATGVYRTMYIGVERGSDDLVCPKPAGWREMREF